METEPDLHSVGRHQVTGHGGNPPGQGPFLQVTLVEADGLILEARYETYQCPGCHACGKALLELVEGKTVAQARTVRHEDVVRLVGPLPKHRQVCYGLAVLALDDALKKLDAPSGPR